MKNYKSGFTSLVILIIVAVIAIGGGTYIYIRHKKAPAPSQNNTTSTLTENSTSSASTSNISTNVQATTSVKIVLPKPKPVLPALSEIDLKYKIKKYFNDNISTCGPPVILPSYQDQQLALFPTIQANSQEYQAIIKNLNLTEVVNFSDEQKLAVVREHNLLSTISLTPSGTGYVFTTRVFTEKPGYNPINKNIEGTITKSGSITLTKSTDYPYGCPVCLSKGTLISTPSGSVAVESLQVGMRVWTVNAEGEKIDAQIIKVGKMSVPDTHYVTHLILKDGRELIVSPNHPTVDGKLIGTLTVGEEIDGSEIVSTTLEKYTNPYTYDLLPEGDTGAYWANGILIGSTLK